LDILEEVGFERDSSVPYKTANVLPHGYLKRLELGRLIALKSELFILDELFSGLSIAEVTSIIPIIEKMLHDGKTIIMVEHRLKELFRIADKVMVLNFGRKIKEGVPKEIMEDEEVRKAVGDIDKSLPENMRRLSRLKLPELSEVEVVRHFLRLSQMNYGVDSGFYPLGSCTMKYNPKINEEIGEAFMKKYLCSVIPGYLDSSIF
jgi:ABC-type multidrug transport system ATPase subunit